MEAVHDGSASASTLIPLQDWDTPGLKRSQKSAIERHREYNLLVCIF